MSNKIILRPAERSDIPEIARLANASVGQSALQRRIAPYQDQYPIGFYHWRLNIVRQRLASPELRTIVAVDSLSGKIQGVATWAVEGPDTPLYKRWVGESTWMDWLELQVVLAEKKWCRYVTDRCIDYKFLDQFMAAFLGDKKPMRPPCIHLHLIGVDPGTQSKGVGRMLFDWGKELATREELPIFLESLGEAKGFYERGGCSRLSEDIMFSPVGQEPVYLPPFVWEGKQMEGRWLERDKDFDGPGERWRWRDDVLPK